MIYTVLTYVYAITLLIGVPTNCVAFFTFCYKLRVKSTAIDVLLLNLTVSDLLFLAFLPLKMKEAMDHMTWKMPSYLCPLTNFLFYTTIYNSTLLLTARPSSGRWSSLNVSIVYVIQSSHIFGGQCNVWRRRPQQHQCYLDLQREAAGRLLQCPCVLELFLAAQTRQRRQRAVGLAAGTLLMFAVSFGPYNLSHVVGYAGLENKSWRHVALISCTANACLDPILFFFPSTTMRDTLGDCLRSATMHLLRCGGCGRGGGGEKRGERRGEREERRERKKRRGEGERRRRRQERREREEERERRRGGGRGIEEGGGGSIGGGGEGSSI
ncbi:hypothetical protein CRUP_038316 [Coryphaenoides rupestris]|nr:hypothetical protein CRUP_038316 [Coryphaenoides rupestris]